MEEEVEVLSESPTMSESPTPSLEVLARGVPPEVTHVEVLLEPRGSQPYHLYGKKRMATIDADIKARGGIINVGDGNAASPGHSANFESKSSIQQKGSAISVHQTCTGCDVTHQWRSQPDIADTPAGNLKLSSAILFSGSCVAKILNLMRHMGIPTITEQTIYMHQRCYLQPAVSSVWEEEMATIDADIKARGGIINVGDGNAASPGHSANFGTYTLLETATKKVLQIELVSISWSFIILFQTFVGLLQMVSVGMMSLQGTEVSSSNAMEKEELVRAMKAIQQRGLKVKEITTDRHTSIRKYLWEKHQDVKHSLDVWHVAKDKGASGSKSGKKTKATGKKTGMSSESHESLLAVSTQQLKTLVTQAVTERFADLQLSRPPTPSPLPTQVVERMDQPIDPTPSLEELLARLQTVVDDKKLRTRDLEEARILLLWKSKTEKKTDDLLANLDVVAPPPAQPRSYRRQYASTHKKFTKRNNVSYAPTAHSSSSSDISDISSVPSNFSGLSDISLSSMYDLAANATDNTCHHTSLLDSEYEPLLEDIADMVLDLKEDLIMDLNHIRLFLLRVQRPTRGRSGRNPPAWVTLSEDGNEDEQTGTADAPNRLIRIKGIPRTHQTTLPLMKMHPMTPEVMMKLLPINAISFSPENYTNSHFVNSILRDDSATMFTDAIPGRIGWIDCKGSSKSLKKPLLIHLVEGLALIRAWADHVNRYPTLKQLSRTTIKNERGVEIEKNDNVASSSPRLSFKMKTIKVENDDSLNDVINHCVSTPQEIEHEDIDEGLAEIYQAPKTLLISPKRNEAAA
ncbi:hypothetical protein GQR58_015057 [Nymphon striatum]|nr:hypothetical protein GQR58_015057 [Nymphon striatum]